MARIEFEIEDYLHEVSDFALKDEMDRRIKDGKPPNSDLEDWTPEGMADDLRAAFYRRDASRFELLLRVLEVSRRVTAGLAA
jgi:hypothetical protein